MTQQLGNTIKISGQNIESFYRFKYLTFEESLHYTNLALNELNELFRLYSVKSVLRDGKVRYLKSDIDLAMLKFISE